MHRGFVLEWRKVEDSGLEQHPYAYTLFRHFCRKAAIKPAKRYFGTGLVEVARGQYITSRRKLANHFGWSESKVRRSLEILTTGRLIGSQQVAHQGTLITVINFDNYNPRPGESYPRFIQRVAGIATHDRPTVGPGSAHQTPEVANNQGVASPYELEELEERKKGTLASQSIQEITEAAIADLNQRTKGKLSPQKVTIQAMDLVHRRVAEGKTRDDFNTVNRKKCAAWLDDEKMRRHLTPFTLYGPKMSNYLAEPEPEKEKDVLTDGWSDEKKAAARRIAKGGK